MKILLAHPGTQHAFRLAHELNQGGRLFRFVTSIAVSQNSLLRTVFRSWLDRRVVHGIKSTKIKSYPSLFVVESVLSMLRMGSEEVYHKRNLLFQKKVILNDINEADVVIGFDTSSWLLAEYCSQNGKKFILDVSIGHAVSKEKVFSRLRARYPEWTDIERPKSKMLIDLEQKEFDLASLIVVPSSFVKSTLIDNGVNPDKISINPFGTSVRQERKYPRDRKSVTFLFLGSLTARKGLPLLLEAWKRANRGDAQMVIAGYGELPKGVMIPKNVEMRGRVSPDNRIALYQEADVFIFPSYFEGLALVLVEAAANGLPIIGTTSSGVEELIVDRQNGLVIESGSLDQLVSSIEYFVHNREQINIMGKIQTERMNSFSWSAYGNRWNEILNKI